MKTYPLALGIGLGSLLQGVGAIAQESPEILEEVVVIAHPLSGEGLSQAATVLQGDELAKKVATNIGETLGREPGIHSAQFGNAVGRPVIHGLGGPRVRVMEDRIDTLDLSVTSADHAVGVDPFVADRIEVLKGPSTLLYGSGAIGGVVDVHTGRIPHDVPDAISGGIESRFDNNVDDFATAVHLDGGIGQFAWHVDGSWKDGDDYEIPGFAESARLRALEAEEESGEEEEEAEERGTLSGSEYDSDSYAGGFSYVSDWGFVGLAVSRLEADYGLPGGHAHEHEEDEEEEEEEEEGNATLELEQTRTDFELGIRDPFGPFSSLNVRFGYNDYEHQEIEPDGAVGTDFSNEAWELRTELVYELTNWKGVVGLQHTDREYSAIGEEAFLDPVDTLDTGVFWVAERDFANFDLEAGLRINRVEHDPEVGSSEDFDTYAGSLGAVMPVGDNLLLGLLLDVSSRAPVAEELFSDGPHLVTNAFERGDANLDEEVAASLSASAAYQSDRWNARVTVYYTDFGDFIYQQATGEIEDDLPVFQYQQEDATFIGLDLEFGVLLTDWEEGSLRLTGMLDVVDAELDVSGNDNIPRIPPLRFGLGLESNWGIWRASVEYFDVSKQDDTAPLELETDAYEDLRAYLGVTFPFAEGNVSIFAQGKNLTDDEQRLHTSFIKDFAPAPGRTVEVGARVTF